MPTNSVYLFLGPDHPSPTLGEFGLTKRKVAAAYVWGKAYHDKKRRYE